MSGGSFFAFWSSGVHGAFFHLSFPPDFLYAFVIILHGNGEPGWMGCDGQGGTSATSMTDMIERTALGDSQIFTKDYQGKSNSVPSVGGHVFSAHESTFLFFVLPFLRFYFISIVAAASQQASKRSFCLCAHFSCMVFELR